MNRNSKIFIALLLAAVAAELTAMAVISRLDGVSALAAALIDSALLAVMLAPAVYLLVTKETAAMRESEEKFRSVFNHASDVILLLDIPPEGMPVIRDVNDSAVRLLGYARGELVGKSVSVLDPGLTGEVISERRRKAAAGIPFTVKHPCKDGTVREFESSARPFTLGGKSMAISVERDITERSRAEEDLRESYEIQGVLNSILRRSLTPLPLPRKLAGHLAALFSIPWLTVQPKGAIFLASGRTLSLAVQQGLPPALLASCAKVPFGKCLCGRAAETGQAATSGRLGPEHETVYEGIAPHGHYCAPIMAAGNLLGVLNLYLEEGTSITGRREDFIRAVTDIIAADILHARTKEQFVHAQRMDAIGHVVGGVAHDFNNILTAITGYAEFLRAALPAGGTARADAEEILRAAGRAAALTRQMLTFSRKQVVELEVLDLDRAVPDILKMIRRMVAEDIEFKTFLNSAPAAVLTNRDQLGQVLVNLAVNARDAMPDGGTLTFETALAELDAAYAAAHPGVLPGRHVMLAVSDTGQGMAPEVRERLFEPFFTTKEQGKGTGLGLSTVYGIVKQSGGSIFVYSEPGKGTSFKIYFPAAGGGAGEKPAGEQARSSYRGTETVLVVEDDESIRRLLCRVLSQNGYTTLEADTPRQAVRLCEQRKDISLMLADIIMPQMNGYELSRAAAALAPRMKVIYMSGYTDNALPPQNPSESARVFLEKPLKVETVLRKIRDVLEEGPR